MLDRRSSMSRRHRWVASIARRAGLAPTHPHMLRAAFIMAALDAGVPLREVQSAARHVDPRTITVYDRRRQNLDRHAAYVVVASVFYGGHGNDTVGGCSPRASLAETVAIARTKCPTRAMSWIWVGKRTARWRRVLQRSSAAPCAAPGHFEVSFVLALPAEVDDLVDRSHPAPAHQRVPVQSHECRPDHRPGNGGGRWHRRELAPQPSYPKVQVCDADRDVT